MLYNKTPSADAVKNLNNRVKYNTTLINNKIQSKV